MTYNKIRRGTFLHIESELFAYHDTRRELIRVTENILHGKGSEDENVGGGRGNLPGDPTGQAATALATYRKLDQMRQMIDAIEKVVSRLTPEKRRMVQLRYWANPRTLTWDGVALEMNVSRRTLIYWRDGIIRAIADQLGWQ